MIDINKKYSLVELKELLKDSNFKSEEYEFEDENMFSFTKNQEFQFNNSLWTLHEINTCWDTEFRGETRTIASQFGWIILKDDEIKYFLTIYEPHGLMVNSKRGSITFHGHEEIKTLWLDDGEINSVHTR